ncbi:hypothetical protein HUU05_12155 [candidate division KSB1 bacterium]|nr:hypothetical protein [candidate division KSB1 bacterium]
MTSQTIESINKTASSESASSAFEQRFLYRHPKEVRQFLEAHPFLVSLLKEARERIDNYFGGHNDVVLEVIAEPNALDDHELFAFVQTDLPHKDALARLERLDEDWWLDASVRAQGKLCIHVKFA